MLQSDREAAQDGLIDRYLGKKPIGNERAIAVRWPADSRPYMINANDIDL